MGKAVEWRSWRTGRTWMDQEATGSILTKCTTLVCTYPAGFGQYCPRQLCELKRNRGMHILIPGQGKT